jgi:hypothetical protein
VTVTAGVSGTLINNLASVDSVETVITTSNIVTHRVVTDTAGGIFLPIVIKDGGTTPICADLQVTAPQILPGNVISVTVFNTGSCATDSNFWVDLYANPATPPSNLVGVTADRRWDSTSVNASHGMAWEVPVLASGASRLLTSDGSGGSPTPVDVSWPPSGSVNLYAFADSFDSNDPNNALYVEIPETNESNNQSGPVIGSFAASLGGEASEVATESSRQDLK